MTKLNDKAFEILVREHHRRLLAYSFSLVDNPVLAEDITQDALVTAFEKLAVFDAKRDFPAWVRGIIRNKYLERCKRNLEVPLEEKDLERLEAAHSEWDALKTDFMTDALGVLNECLGKLPEIFKPAVDFYYMKELTACETAARLGISDSTLRKRLQRARENLGDCINESIERQTS